MTHQEWQQLALIEPTELTTADLFRCAYVLTELSDAPVNSTGKKSKFYLEGIECSLVNFDEHTLTLRFAAETRERFDLDVEYVRCAASFVRWAPPVSPHLTTID